MTIMNGYTADLLQSNVEWEDLSLLEVTPCNNLNTSINIPHHSPGPKNRCNKDKLDEGAREQLGNGPSADR